MREILAEIVHQCSPFDAVRVTGTEDQTRIQGKHEGQLLFLDSYLKQPVPEFIGQFGLNDLPMLSGLMNLSTYKADGATMGVKRDDRGGTETVTEILFRDPLRAGSSYKTMMAALVGGQAEIAKTPWDVSIVPSKAKIAEFAQIAGLYGKIRDAFSISLIEGNLIFSVGSHNANTHSATMVFASDLTGSLDLKAQEFKVAQFLAVLKLAGNNPTKVNITTRGLIQISVEAEYGSYIYTIRGDRAK